MSQDVGEAIIRIRYQEDGFNPGQAGKDSGKAYAGGFTNSIKGLGGVLAGALAAAGVGTFLKGAITGASDLQETISKTGVVFGKAAEDIFAFADTGAAALGLSKQAALDAAGTFGIFGKAAGLTGGDLSAFSTDLTSLAVDMASFSNSTPEEAIEAIGAALRGEAEPIRSFGVLLDDATLKQEALRLGLIKTDKEGLTPQQKTLAAQAAIMRQTSDAQGDFERTSGGLANQQRILAAQFDDLQAKLGTALLPVVLQVVKGLNGLFGSAEALGPVIDAVGDSLSGLFSGGSPAELDGITSSLGQFVDGLRMAFDVLRSGDDVAAGLGETLDYAFGNTGELAAPIQDAATSIMDAIGNIGAAAEDVLPIISDLILNQIVPAVAGLATSIVSNLLPVFAEYAAFVTGTIVPALVTLVGFIADNLGPVITGVIDLFANGIIPVFATVADFVYNTLIPAVVAIYTQVAENLAPVFTTLSEVIVEQILPALQQAADKIQEDLIPALEPIISTVVSVIGWLARLASTILGVVLPPLLRMAGFILANVIPAVVNIITWIARLIGGLISVGKAIGGAIGWFVRIQTTMVSFAVKAVGGVVSAVSALPGKILALGGRLLNAGKSIIGQFLRGLAGGAELVSDIAGNVWDALRGLLNSGIDKINAALEFTIKGPGPLPDVGVNPPNIPHLQSGSRYGVDAGSYLVGEVGPERVYLPDGARVLTAAQTAQADGRGGMDANVWAAALVAALAPLLERMRPVTFMLPSGDPEAAAQAAIDRLATV